MFLDLPFEGTGINRMKDGDDYREAIIILFENINSNADVLHPTLLLVAPWYAFRRL